MQQQAKGVSGVQRRDPKQIGAGLTCPSAELSPIAEAARVAPAGRVRVTRASWARGLSLARPRGGGRRAGWQVVLKERSEYELLHSHTHTLPISFL